MRKLFSKTTLMATLALALAFIFSACTDGNHDWLNGDESSSGSCQQTYSYCITANNTCLTGPFAASDCNGQVANTCPNGLSPSVGSSSSVGSTPSTQSSSSGDKIGYTGYTTDTLATGTFESRRYKVEVWNIRNKVNYDTLSEGKGVSLKNYVISKGGTKLDSLTNQTFSDVISKWNSAGVLGSSKAAEGVNVLTDRLQTKKVGITLWFTNGTTSRYFSVARTSEGVYTVVVYNISSATYTHLDIYNGKAGWDYNRAYLNSNGCTLLNTYTNQTFSDVLSKYTSAASSIGFTNSDMTSGTNYLTESLKTNNRRRSGWLFYKSSEYRNLLVEQE